MSDPSSRPKVLAIIPARGGSKSLPRKNILPLQGRPMIAYSIEDALRSAWIQRVIVSTDDAEIASIARGFGAEVPFLRPPEISGDRALDIEYLAHALRWLSEHEGYRPDLVVTLRPTEPMRRVEVIDRAIERLASTPDADSLRSVRPAKETPYKMWHLGADGFMSPVAGIPGVAEPYNQPRQSLPKVHWQDGYVDVARASTILDQGSSTGRRVIGFVIEEEGVNIDYPEELAQAEEAMKNRGSAPAPRSERFPS